MTAPAGDVLRQFLPRDKPCLILIDELMNYVSRSRKSGMATQLYNFLQNLSEEARGQKNIVLAVSIPASELEMNAEDQSDYRALQEAARPAGQAGHHVGRRRDLRDHSPSPLRLGRRAGQRRQEDRSGLRRVDRGPPSAGAELVPHRPRPRDVRGDLPLSPDDSVGLRAEVAGPAALPADARHAASSGPLGVSRLPGRLQGRPSRPAHRRWARRRWRIRFSARPCSSSSARLAWKERSPPTSAAKRTRTPSGWTRRPRTP